MTTVLTIGDSDGERRCTAACHEARGPICECICQGRFHGIAWRPRGVEAFQRELQDYLVEHVEALGPLFAHARNGGADCAPTT